MTQYLWHGNRPIHHFEGTRSTGFSGKLIKISPKLTVLGLTHNNLKAAHMAVNFIRPGDMHAFYQVTS